MRTKMEGTSLDRLGLNGKTEMTVSIGKSRDE